MDDMCYGMLHISDIKKCRIIKKLHAGSLTMGFFLGVGGMVLKNLIHVLNILEWRFSQWNYAFWTIEQK